MARVHHRKARKDYPEKGIKKGDMYYFAQIKTGPRSSRTIRQLEPIKQSQLTSSDFLSQLYGIEEGFDEIVHDESAVEALNDAATTLRDLGQEQQDKFDNMPDGLQQGDTGQMLEERANNCEQWADEIEQIASNLESAITEINNKPLEDLEDLGYDLDDEDAEEPDEETVQEARDREITDAVAEAIQEVQSANPGF
jgi:hypothetical protein